MGVHYPREVSAMRFLCVFKATEGAPPSAKEAAEMGALIGEFALIQTSSMSEAVEWTKRFIRVAGDGETEIRELHDTPAFANS
jgi:hypothetical protein